MCGKTMNDKIRNEHFGEHLKVAIIGDKIIETHLRLFWHVQRMSTIVLVMKSLAMIVDGLPRERSKLKRMWMEVVKIDIKKCNLSKILTQDRSE